MVCCRVGHYYQLASEFMSILIMKSTVSILKRPLHVDVVFITTTCVYRVTSLISRTSYSTLGVNFNV